MGRFLRWFAEIGWFVCLLLLLIGFVLVGALAMWLRWGA